MDEQRLAIWETALNADRMSDQDRAELKELIRLARLGLKWDGFENGLVKKAAEFQKKMDAERIKPKTMDLPFCGCPCCAWRQALPQENGGAG